MPIKACTYSVLMMPTFFVDTVVWLGKLIPFYVTFESCLRLWNWNWYMLFAVALMDARCGIYGIRILTQFYIAWRKALRRVWNLPFNTVIHIVIFCLNCLMLALYATWYANECYLLLLSVFIVTVTLLKRLLDVQFYMIEWLHHQGSGLCTVVCDLNLILVVFSTPDSITVIWFGITICPMYLLRC